MVVEQQQESDAEAKADADHQDNHSREEHIDSPILSLYPHTDIGKHTIPKTVFVDPVSFCLSLSIRPLTPFLNPSPFLILVEGKGRRGTRDYFLARSLNRSSYFPL